MSATENLEQLVAEYYATEAPPRAPDRLLAQALDTIDTTPQRRTGLGRPWPIALRLAATLALLALVAAASAYIGSRLTPPVDLGIFEPVSGRIVYGNEYDFGIDDGIWGIDPASSDPTTTVQLTAEPGTPLGWSSDGTRLLIQKDNENLFVLHADGSETQVTEQLSGFNDILGSSRPAGATISPDGSRVVFAGLTNRESGRSCHDGALFAVDADGGPAEVLWESQAADEGGIVRDPTFSPDGTQIAFADGYCDSNHSVWVMNADGSDAHQIVDIGPLLGATHVHGLAWSPAGDRIALEVDQGIYTFATDGSDFTQIIAPGIYPRPGPYWSPDGSQIAYTTGCAGEDADGTILGCILAIADADGSNVRAFGSGTSGPWHPGTPSPSVGSPSAAVSETGVDELLNEFLAARIAGEGAEPYLLGSALPDGSPSWPAPTEAIPLLYATSSGAPYERGEFEQVRGIEWPFDLAAFKVRLIAGDTVVDQLFFSPLDGPSGLGYVRDGFATAIAPTTEDGQAVAGPPCDFDGYLTLRPVHPWVIPGDIPDSLCVIQLIPENAGASPTTGFDQRAGWDELALMADPAWVSTDCQTSITEPDAATLAASIRSDPGLEATDPVAVTFGEVEGLMLDVRIAAGANGCVNVDANGTPADPGALFPVLPLTEGSTAVNGRALVPATGDWMRLYLFDPPEGSDLPTVEIAVVAPESTFDRAVEAAGPVIGSIEFNTP